MRKYIEDMKRRAKAIAREGDAKHTQALDQIARSQGYSHWGALLKQHDKDQDTKDVLLPCVLIENGQSIAQKIELLLNNMHAKYEEAEVAWTDEDWSLVARVAPNFTDVPERITIKGQETKNAFEKRMQADISTIFDLIEVRPREGGVMSILSEGSIRTVFQMKFRGGTMWESHKTADGAIHAFSPRSAVPLTPYLPDTPDSWIAAHNWTIHSCENYEYVDPLLWGFKPTGLTINPPGGWSASGVTGCRYDAAELSEYAEQKDFKPKVTPIESEKLELDDIALTRTVRFHRPKPD